MLYTEKDDVITVLLSRTFRVGTMESELLVSNCTQELCVAGEREGRGLGRICCRQKKRE